MLAPGSSVVYRIAAALPSEAVIADSNAVAAAGARFWPRVRRIRTIYPGVGLPSGVGVGLRTEIGVPADTQLVAVVGRLQRWKGQEDFLEAATLIAAEHASAHFLVVGGPMFGLDPGFPEELRAKAARSSVNGRVHFLGPRSDVERLLPELDVLVVPSRTPEPFGTIQIEAMAAGVPVVSTAAGGNIEVVDDGVCGYLVPPRDPRLISEAVIRLLADPALCRSMGESGRVRVKNRFSLDRMVDEMCQVFESVAG
jgi:glycosyltransferase involved in cell wall biosynthesis